MNRPIWVILFIFAICWQPVKAQRVIFSYMNLSALIKERVEDQFQQWAQKGEFESTAQYQVRMERKEDKVAQLTADAVHYFKREHIQTVNFDNYLLHMYDADQESFKISLDKLGDFPLHVPLAEAPDFKRNHDRLRFNNLDFKIRDNEWVLSYIEVYNPSMRKTFVYDLTIAPDYDPKEFNPKIQGLEVQLPEDVMLEQVVDVSLNIPETDRIRANTFAVIIGNEAYENQDMGSYSLPNVPYAKRDAIAFRNYAVRTLGIPRNNIEEIPNGSSAKIQLGIKKAVQKAKLREGELIIYYAGHGFPDVETKDAYLVPIDVNTLNLTDAGIKLSELYAQVTDPQISRTTVILDACFSGAARKGEMVTGARSVRIKPKDEPNQGNLVVLAATTGVQAAHPYPQARHGLFTYYLLKKLQESQGMVNYGELSEYIKKEVTFKALEMDLDQVPRIILSPDLQSDGDWRTWPF
ncbi:caspase family protein [Pontibacter sp. G13]|uniref:caspase family protein n=1 Tax=Pontibacter sp. G13 TaxID=3074898 RepID=UPI00288AF174|nr:caspase family protein [Pontibacter sp. G13]WNJ19246.1 caspase family protein [Pontibacter sp. G13]